MKCILGLLFFIVPIIFLHLNDDVQDLRAIIPIIMSWIGLIIILDVIYRIRRKNSLFLGNGIKSNLRISATSVLFCILIEIFGVYFTRLWFYPRFNISTYIFIVLPAFISYGFVLLILFILFKKKKDTKQDLINANIYKKIILIELLLGIVGAIVSGWYLIMKALEYPGNYFDITNNPGIYVQWWLTFVTLLSVFFIFEFLSYRQQKITLTYRILQRDGTAFIAILLANIVAVVCIEYVNAPLGVWRFANWPFDNFSLYTIPVVALLAWPFQFLTYLAMLRYFTSSKELEIW